MPQRAVQGRWKVQVAAETPKTAHTWQRRMPRRAWQEAFHREWMRTDGSDAGTSGRARHTRHFPPENAANDTWQYVRQKRHFYGQNCVPEPFGRRNAPLPGQKPDAQTRQCSSTAARTGALFDKSPMLPLPAWGTTVGFVVADKCLIISEIMICPVWFCRQVKCSFA